MIGFFQLTYRANGIDVQVKLSHCVDSSSDKMELLNAIAEVLGAKTKEQLLVVVSPEESFPEDENHFI